MWMFIALCALGEEPEYTRFVAEIELVDVPENLREVPSMPQALHLSAGLYDAAYLGIDALGGLVVDPEEHPLWNAVVEQPVAGLFVHFGRELPIPLAIWGHEEYHRSALRAGGIHSRNGNWLGARWNGTVYGVADADLMALKAHDPAALARAMSAGIEYQVHLTREVTTTDFEHRRAIPRSLLLLDNAWYVYDYVAFAASEKTDLQKEALLEFAGATERDRDFVGNDLTGWAYDMRHPRRPWEARGPHPNGVGVARPIGWSDLDPDSRAMLRTAKWLTLLNFANPAAFFVPRFRLSDAVSFNAFLQHYPTSFGQSVDTDLLVAIDDLVLFASVQTRWNHERWFPGVELQVVSWKVPVGKTTLTLSPRLGLWLQPHEQRFGTSRARPGALAEVEVGVPVVGGLEALVRTGAKTAGFVMGNPYLGASASASVGVRYAWTR